MLEESTTGCNLSRKATLLMAEILQSANRVLPLSAAANLQVSTFLSYMRTRSHPSVKSMPRIFNLASNYESGEQRIVGSLAFSAIDSFNRNRARLQPAAKSSRPRLGPWSQFCDAGVYVINMTRSSSVEDAVRRGQRHVEQVKIKMGLQMDDKTFQSSLIETQVNISRCPGNSIDPAYV
jgi:rapamycin-insensitive companion of mTOR